MAGLSVQPQTSAEIFMALEYCFAFALNDVWIGNEVSISPGPVPKTSQTHQVSLLLNLTKSIISNH